MGISGILTVLWYTALPFLTWIILALALLIGVQVIARTSGYRTLQCQCRKALWVSIAVGLLSIVVVPFLTGSQLSMVTTVFDWVALLGIAVGVGVYAWLILHPIWFITRRYVEPATA